jgi:DNA-damage-inducible protein D
MSKEMGLEPIQFENFEIRRLWDEESQQWYFAIVDIIGVLTDSSNPRRYWSDLKRKLTQEGATQLYENIVQLKVPAADGKQYKTDCTHTEGVLRIIQSVTSPKAEPFKQWLAQVGYERLQEIENPELAAERFRQLYKAQGYSDEWIERRLQSVITRNELTDEWKQRGVEEGQEYAFLTADIARETFGITPGDHKKLKKLKRENLRDHMTGLELAFTILGEAATTEITRQDDTQGFAENQVAARKGGRIAGNARRELETETGKPVVSKTNYLERPQAEQEKLTGRESNPDAEV